MKPALYIHAAIDMNSFSLNGFGTTHFVLTFWYYLTGLVFMRYGNLGQTTQLSLNALREQRVCRPRNVIQNVRYLSNGAYSINQSIKLNFFQKVKFTKRRFATVPIATSVILTDEEISRSFEMSFIGWSVKINIIYKTLNDVNRCSI